MKRLSEESKQEIIERRRSQKIWTIEEFLNYRCSILRESFEETEMIADLFKKIYPQLKYYPSNWEPHELCYSPDPRCVYFDRGASFSDRERNPYQRWNFDFYDYCPGEWVSIKNLQK